MLKIQTLIFWSESVKRLTIFFKERVRGGAAVMRSEKLQVPKIRDICSNKKYYDVLYSYLQCVSIRDEKNNRRVFSKKYINFSKLGEMLGLSRQTVSTKFKNLKELGLVQEIDKETYELIELENYAAMLIPYDTLKLLTDALSENSISVYTFLFNEYYKKQYKSFQFTLAQVKTHIGICSSTRSNDDIVTNILYVLEKIGLIHYSLTTTKRSDDAFQNVKTIYQIDWMTTKLG